MPYNNTNDLDVGRNPILLNQYNDDNSNQLFVPPGIKAIITENSFFIITEAGQFIITES